MPSQAQTKLHGTWLKTAGAQLLAASLLTGCLEVPSAVLLNAGSEASTACQYPSGADKRPLPSSFSVLSWNIYKQQGDWQTELEQWMAGNDLLVLQEAQASADLYTWLRQQEYHWFQVAAFNWNDRANGVLTAAKGQVTHVCGQRILEPATRIPKSLLYSYYLLEGSPQQLLLVNLHAINFSLRGRTYHAQLDMVSQVIRDYSGPVIVAGDFNSWNARRQGFLNRWAASEQLTEALPEPDVRTRFMGYPLDGVFYRGLELEQASSMASAASDHSALQMRFRIQS